jgi:FtsP/CotA-like multicopper oxidase with cupredoxin domain
MNVYEAATKLIRDASILILPALAGLVACGGSSSPPAAQPDPVPPPDPIVQPEVRRSANGILRTTLEAVVATNSIVENDTGLQKEVETTTYEGRLIGPTLRVRAGDRLSIEVINSLPSNPDQARKGAFPHQPYTTNLHTHGLTVSPEGIGDNPFREMLPQSVNEFEVEIPDFHPAGTFWYHPHKHGSVSFQFFGGMAGFLIVDGGPGTIDAVPEIRAARELVLGFQAIRVDADGRVPWVDTEAVQFSNNGAWSNYIDTSIHLLTNGETAPTYNMQPGEVQRWRILNAASGLTLVVGLQSTALNIIAHDGLSLTEMLTLPADSPLVLGSGSRADVLVQAPAPGTYLLQAFDPGETPHSVSPQGVAPQRLTVKVGNDFPDPVYPVTLATIVVEGAPLNMALPSGPLPERSEPITTESLLAAIPDVKRQVVFETCGQSGNQSDPTNRLPSCQHYFEKYDAAFWGGLPFENLLMIRDAGDDGTPIDPADPSGPHTGYLKEGLFNPNRPLFDDMHGGNIEEWTVLNRGRSDHSFHIHQNPFLVTHINGQPLPVPEWRDTMLVPAATGGGANINLAVPGSITMRTYLHPDYTGRIITHCHMLTHEDFGMMQALEIKPSE